MNIFSELPRNEKDAKVFINNERILFMRQHPDGSWAVVFDTGGRELNLSKEQGDQLTVRLHCLRRSTSLSVGKFHDNNDSRPLLPRRHRGA